MSTRAELRQSGEAMRRRLFGNAGDGGVFLLVGSLQPNLGGGILASNTFRSDLQRPSLYCPQAASSSFSDPA